MATSHETIDQDGAPASLAVLHLQVAGTLKAWNETNDSMLPRSRKAQAVLVVIALSDGETITRRRLASLLWSRNEPAQALARLRDTLHGMRREMHGADADGTFLRLVGDQVGFRPGAVWTDVLHRVAGAPDAVKPGEIAADLDGLDPALDAWLADMRQRLGRRLIVQQRPAERPLPDPPGAARPVGFRRPGAVIGVAPLRVIGPQVADYLTFALAEEIAAALARLRWLVVISNESVASVLASRQNLRATLGVDFVLEGTIQRVEQRLRIGLKLVDAEGGAVAWQSHCEYEDGDLFGLQEKVAASVAASLGLEIPMLQLERMKHGGPVTDGAYGLVLRAITCVHNLERESFVEAGALLEQAIRLDPAYAAAHAWLALWNIFRIGQGWAPDVRTSIVQAGEAAEHAITLDPNDARGLTIAGHVMAFLHCRLDEAMALHERALATNPSLPLAWHLSGVAHAYAGNMAEARKRLVRCRALTPRDPHGFFADGALIIVELLEGHHAAAVAMGRRVTQLHPRFSAAYKPYLAALGHLGARDEATLIHRRLTALEPDFTLSSFEESSPFASPRDFEHYREGLRLGGVC